MHVKPGPVPEALEPGAPSELAHNLGESNKLVLLRSVGTRVAIRSDRRSPGDT